jgi:hypothetical protein
MNPNETKSKSHGISMKAAIAGMWAASMVAASSAQAVENIKWSEALTSGDSVSVWIRGVVVVVMAIFIMVSLILGSLAFKQLAADGNWKDFWSKIAGSVGMFVTPIAIYWLVSK